MAMTRKHYRQTAEIIAGEMACYPDAAPVLRRVTYSLADMFKQDNSNFDRQRFYDACGLND